jgi:hypothetical protein
MSASNNGEYIWKSLYALKQAPKQWHEKFNEILISDGFSSIEVNKCVYIKSFGWITCYYVPICRWHNWTLNQSPWSVANGW